MKKIDKYIVAIYASGIIGLGTCAYTGYHLISDKPISEKTINTAGSGMILCALLFGVGAVGGILEKKEENKLEKTIK